MTDPTAAYERHRGILDRLTEAEGEAMASAGIPLDQITAFGHKWQEWCLPDLADALDDLELRSRIAETREIADWIDENAEDDCDPGEPASVKARQIAMLLRRSADATEERGTL